MSSDLGLEEKLEALKPSLTGMIHQWITRNCEGENWTAVGCCGDDLAKLMADAAFLIIRSSIDVQKYMHREYEIND